MRAVITGILVFGSVTVAAAQGGQTSAQTTTQTTTQTAPQTRGGRGTTELVRFRDGRMQSPVFEIAVRRYGADGAMTGLAGNSAWTGEFQSYVWTTPSLCGLSASSEEPANVAGHGWHLKGNVTSRTGDQVTVHFEWRRMWDSGKKIADGASGTKDVTLRDGERLELDRVVPTGASSCGATEAKLEAALVPRSALRLTSTNWTVGPGATGYVGRGTSTGTTSGTATTGAAGAGAGGARGTATTTRGAATAARGTAPTPTGRARGATPTTTQSGTGTTQPGGRGFTYFNVGALSYDAELWLVHRKPDGTETVQQQTVRFTGASFDFKFPEISVPSSRGAVTVDVTGKLQAFVGDPPDPNADGRRLYRLTTIQNPNAPAQPVRVMLTLARRARATGNPFIDTTGSSSMILDVPKPEDVLSFEFPALQKATEDLLKGHVFSLRVRITAAK